MLGRRSCSGRLVAKSSVSRSLIFWWPHIAGCKTLTCPVRRASVSYSDSCSLFIQHPAIVSRQSSSNWRKSFLVATSSDEPAVEWRAPLHFQHLLGVRTSMAVRTYRSRDLCLSSSCWNRSIRSTILHPKWAPRRMKLRAMWCSTAAARTATRLRLQMLLKNPVPLARKKRPCVWSTNWPDTIRYSMKFGFHIMDFVF